MTNQGDEHRKDAAGAKMSLKDIYAQAFSEFGTRSLWNMRQFEDPTKEDMLAAAKQLRKEGDLQARRMAEQIERALNAHL